MGKLVGSPPNDDGFPVTYSRSLLTDQLRWSHPRCLADPSESWVVFVVLTGSHARLCMKAGTADFAHHLCAGKTKTFLIWKIRFKSTANQKVEKNGLCPSCIKLPN